VLFTPYYFSHRAALEFAGVEASPLLALCRSKSAAAPPRRSWSIHLGWLGALWGGSGTAEAPRAARGRAGDAGARAGGQVIPCDCDDELNPDPDALAEAFVAAARAGATVRMVVVCNPGNPSGAVLPKAQLDRIATLCRDQARPLARPLPPPPLLSNPLPLLLPSPPALLLRSPRRRARTPPPQPR